jgi:CRISPR-associated endonuclease/helicase Cas3
VQRHRQQRCESPNIFVFDFNLKHFEERRGEPVFLRPGFEAKISDPNHPFRLVKHSMGKLLREDEYATVTARPRIQPRPTAQWTPKTSLVDLEHARMVDAMLPRQENTVDARGTKPAATGLNAASAWQHPQAALTWALPQHQRFRDDSDMPETELVFLPDDDEERLVLHWIHPQRHGQPDIYARNDNLLERVDLERLLGPRISRWGQDELLPLLMEQAEAQDLPVRRCAERFAVVSVLDSVPGWRYHPGLGFAKKCWSG